MKGKGKGEKDRLRVCREGRKGRKALSWRERASGLLIPVISQYRATVARMAFWQQAGGQRGGG
jgi:hypothetical protein